MSTPDVLPIHQRFFRYLRRSWWPYILAIGPGMLAASAGNDAGGIATPMHQQGLPTGFRCCG
ncbi:MAG: hypothetical protein EBS29_02165 [Chloroflexia bacterium]|nr:hypothetical protein [Chloroflexia bacterium]